MGSKDSQHRKARKTNFETLEDRQVFSADPLAGALGAGVEHHAFEEPQLELHSEPVLEQHGQDLAVELHGDAVLDQTPSLVQHVERAADFWIDSSLETDVDVLFDKIEQTLASAHNLTGAVQARADYGFTGVGQTVVVIDSGIAWNHYALGGGYGANYRVVGGWDFAENDADPFDDGNAGKHGTHVAGIVGANAGTSGDSGVAPGADLVALRVFDDVGNGFFSWVENALRWVHTNKDAYENPITAINLSLGTSWNSASAPSWAMLEEEFAQLEADGIFISVSAGNSFTTYNAKGLSYPAASSHVVPVMSVDDNGNMSSFSQRHERAIGAPGRAIRSTLPDYAGNKNGITDDWGNLSGTSMAAPYVAGASAIVRQAMEFVGRTGIDQWDIYDHMMATADLFYDSATSTTYKRLDLKAAIDALMPTDDYGSSVVDAHDLGAFSGSGTTTLNGTLAKLDDADYFRFTASATGTVTFDLEGVATWITDALPSHVLNGDTLTFMVVAGESYMVGVRASGQVSHYAIDIGYSLTATVNPTAIGQAYELDQDLGLYFSGSYARNWGGMNEKWMKATDNSWYFITPDGTLYHWAGGTPAQIGNSEAVATLSWTHYAHPNLLHDAPDVEQSLQDLAYELDLELNWQTPTSYSTNWGGINEKWIRSADNKWYFVTPNGSLYEWNGQSDLSTSRWMWQFDASAHQTPWLLHDATSTQISLPQLAFELDQQLGLHFHSSYTINWGGWNEKWMRAADTSWYFIRPDGRFYHWNGLRDLSSSQLVATLSSAYHTNPALIHDAFAVGSAQGAAAASLLSTLDVSTASFSSNMSIETVKVAASRSHYQSSDNWQPCGAEAFADEPTELNPSRPRERALEAVISQRDLRANASAISLPTLVTEPSDSDSEAVDRLFEQVGRLPEDDLGRETKRMAALPMRR